MIWTRSIALTGLLAAACAGPAISKPLEIWMIGSDIGAPEVILTHELRDALEARVTTMKLEAPATGEHVYVPEFVQIRGDKFTYRAMLSLDNQLALREARGTCSRSAIETCARQILAELRLTTAS